MSSFEERLDECFESETIVLKELNTIPVGELNRILNQTEIKRNISISDKGAIGSTWDQFFKASRKRDTSLAKKSLAKLIMGYGIMIQFLGQPKNKRGAWLKNFLRATQGEDKK